jgi:uncharacterized protein (TIGR02452 family)
MTVDETTGVGQAGAPLGPEKPKKPVTEQLAQQALLQDKGSAQSITEHSVKKQPNALPSLTELDTMSLNDIMQIRARVKTRWSSKVLLPSGEPVSAKSAQKQKNEYLSALDHIIVLRELVDGRQRSTAFLAKVRESLQALSTMCPTLCALAKTTLQKNIEEKIQQLPWDPSWAQRFTPEQRKKAYEDIVILTTLVNEEQLKKVRGGFECLQKTERGVRQDVREAFQEARLALGEKVEAPGKGHLGEIKGLRQKRRSLSDDIGRAGRVLHFFKLLGVSRLHPQKAQRAGGDIIGRLGQAVDKVKALSEQEQQEGLELIAFEFTELDTDEAFLQILKANPDRQARYQSIKSDFVKAFLDDVERRLDTGLTLKEINDVATSPLFRSAFANYVQLSSTWDQCITKFGTARLQHLENKIHTQPLPVQELRQAFIELDHSVAFSQFLKQNLERYKSCKTNFVTSILTQLENSPIDSGFRFEMNDLATNPLFIEILRENQELTLIFAVCAIRFVGKSLSDLQTKVEDDTTSTVDLRCEIAELDRNQPFVSYLEHNKDSAAQYRAIQDSFRGRPCVIGKTKESTPEILTGVFEDTMTALRNGYVVRGEPRRIEPNAIQQMKEKTKIFRTSEIPLDPTKKGKFQTTYSVVNQDSLQAAKPLAQEGKRPLVLNLANAQSPGGGVRHGSRAQEEDLSRCSDLCLSLFPEENHTLAAQLHSNKYHIPETGAILTPGVTVFRDGTNGYCLLDEPYQVDILSSAAYNLKEGHWGGPKGQIGPGGKPSTARYSFEEGTKMKLRAQLAIAAERGYTNLVLGAFGCGAFGGNPQQIAAWYKELLDGEFKGVFESVTFAVLASEHSEVGQRNLAAFQSAFPSQPVQQQ